MNNSQKMELHKIGYISKENGSKIVIDQKYRKALTELNGFSHIIVYWWADKYEEYRFQIDSVIDLPYAPGQKAGFFATRSPVRPNPVCSTVCETGDIDIDQGVIQVGDIDASENTPVLVLIYEVFF